MKATAHAFGDSTSERPMNGACAVSQTAYKASRRRRRHSNGRSSSLLSLTDTQFDSRRTRDRTSLCIEGVMEATWNPSSTANHGQTLDATNNPIRFSEQTTKTSGINGRMVAGLIFVGYGNDE
uniref:Uncharacterized protein n=1 Tax=Ascaris lumbricoides TaxID=6252 RepID=A0A0M3HVE8_ASCLU